MALGTTPAAALRAAAHLGITSARPVMLRFEQEPLRVQALLPSEVDPCPDGAQNVLVMDSWEAGTRAFAVVAGPDGRGDRIVAMPTAQPRLVFYAWTRPDHADALPLWLEDAADGAALHVGHPPAAGLRRVDIQP